MRLSNCKLAGANSAPDNAQGVAYTVKQNREPAALAAGRAGMVGAFMAWMTPCINHPASPHRVLGYEWNLAPESIVFTLTLFIYFKL